MDNNWATCLQPPMSQKALDINSWKSKWTLILAIGIDSPGEVSRRRCSQLIF